MKFSIKDFFSECNQIRRKLRIWLYLLKKCLMENFIFFAVIVPNLAQIDLLTYSLAMMLNGSVKSLRLKVLKPFKTIICN